MNKPILITLSAFSAALFAILVTACRDINSIGDPHFDKDGMPLDTVALFSPVSPQSVKLYIETSGSMNGFFRANKANNFKKTVWSVFSGLSGLTDGTVYPMSNGGDIDAPVPLEEFRNKMNAGAFVSSSSTRIPSMLSNIIQNIDTARNEVAILVSDMKYSPMGKAAAPELIQYQEQIRNIIGNRPDISVSFVCAHSEFLNHDGSVAAEKSPYYYIIIGKSDNVAAERNNIARWCEATGTYIESRDMAMDYLTPPYSIQQIANGLSSIRYPQNLITGFNRNLSDTCSFIIRIDMVGYPWGAINNETLNESLEAKTSYGSSISVNLLTDEKHLVDDHAYKGEFKRMSYADYQIKVFDMVLDDEVVEWTFSSKPFDTRFPADFYTIINATDESDLSGSFSFYKFIEGCFNAQQNTCNESPVRIFISSGQEK